MNYRDKLLKNTKTLPSEKITKSDQIDKPNVSNVLEGERVEKEERKDLWAESELFPLAYEIVNYCRQEAPTLLTSRASLNSVLEVLKTYIKVPDLDDSQEEELTEEEYMDEGFG